MDPPVMTSNAPGKPPARAPYRGQTTTAARGLAGRLAAAVALAAILTGCGHRPAAPSASPSCPAMTPQDSSHLIRKPGP